MGLRIYLHDYGRYPFIGQLARALAARGHVVALAGSGGDSRRGEDQSGAGVDVRIIRPGITIPKTSFVKRAAYERGHGRAVVADMEAFQPDLVISANAPTLAQVQLARWCRRGSVPFVFWLQDLLGAGAVHVLQERLGRVGRSIGEHLSGMELRMLREADHVVAISDAFAAPLTSAGRTRPTTVIPNWAPLDDTPSKPRSNEWSKRHGLEGVKTVLYSGTLGMKHDPHALLALAASLKADEKLVVVAEGSGTDVLRGAKGLVLLPLQPYADLPLVLGSADVLLAALLPEAGAYCVPSKVLTYLCASRPIILSAPADNDASKMVVSAGAGHVAAPGDHAGLIAAVRVMLDDEGMRKDLGAAARAHAEDMFDIARICDHFEKVLFDAMRLSGAKSPTIKDMEATNEG